MPKKVKYRKQQRGRMTGKAWRGSELSFGDFGLKVLEPGWITDRQIEASRVAMTRFVKRGGKICVPKMAIPGVGWLAYAEDPAGNVFGIIEPDTNTKVIKPL